MIAFTALSRGRVAGISGRVEEARAAFATAIEAYGEIGDDGLVLVARSDLAHALRHNGLAEESVAVYRETLPAWQHTGNRGAIANQLESVAMLAAERQPEVLPLTPRPAPAHITTPTPHKRGHATSDFGLVTEEVPGTGPLGTHPVVRVEQSAGAQREAAAADAAGQAVPQSFEFDDALIETIAPGS